MNRLLHTVIPTILLSVAFIACGQKGGVVKRAAESRQAKQLLQGVWSDEDAETVIFKMQGDSVYYPDSTSMPAYFMVVDDTLYIGSSARYAIKKQTLHTLWFQYPNGELVKLVKNDEESQDETFGKGESQILMPSEVLKRDTVVMYEGLRYHLYVAVNPTRIKVVRHTLNDDGLDVENVYYDNIIHLSVFQGSRQVFSRDFRKRQFEHNVPGPFLEQAILNNIEYDGVEADGFHFLVSLCQPGDASCYQVEHVVSFDGKLSALP